MSRVTPGYRYRYRLLYPRKTCTHSHRYTSLSHHRHWAWVVDAPPCSDSHHSHHHGLLTTTTKIRHDNEPTTTPPHDKAMERAETEGFVGSHWHGDFERSLKQIKPVTRSYGYRFFRGTKVCTRTRTPELPVTLPAGISVPVTFPKYILYGFDSCDWEWGWGLDGYESG